MSRKPTSEEMRANIDSLYEKVDDLCWKSEWTTIDLMVRALNSEVSLEMRVAILVITLACKQHLTNRVEFYDKTWNLAKEAGKNPGNLLSGLL
jgi:hypothetical protein